MTKAEQNKAIAKILGFEAYGITVNGRPNADFGWSYPEEYRNHAACCPQRTVPDFVGLILKTSKFIGDVGHSGIFSKDYGTYANIEDLDT